MRVLQNSAVIGLLLLAAACQPTKTPTSLVCDAGSTAACTCADGSQGTQTCGANGSGFGACGSCAGPDGGANGDSCKGKGFTGLVCNGTCLDVQSDPANCGTCGNVCGANSTCTTGSCRWNGTQIQHVVVIVQENHTFDSYFGRYCTAPAYSNPTCTTGRGCCEAAPATDPNGFGPTVLTDGENYNSDHDHGVDCEVCQLHDGGMDRFTDGGCPNSVSGFASIVTYDCSTPENFSIATDSTEMATYWSYADQYALADRYFQPIAGGTSSNDMYLAVAHYEFSDNEVMPPAIGAGCTTDSSPQPGTALTGRTTIGDVLVANGNTFGAYADGYADALMASPNCPSGASTAGGTPCREQFFTSACVYDPSDVPFQYYPQFTDNPAYIHDLTEFFTAVNAGSLPDVAYVKYRTSGNEHPEWSYITDGETNVDAVVQAVLASPTYQSNTLILLTWDEGGGFFDHVPPPPSIETYPAGSGARDGLPIPYGTRVPLIAMGRFARAGAISHVPLEHSSIVRFLEWNFVGPDGEGAIHATQPAARDATVNNLGSLLDATAVGMPVP